MLTTTVDFFASPFRATEVVDEDSLITSLGSEASQEGTETPTTPEATEEQSTHWTAKYLSGQGNKLLREEQVKKRR